MIFVKSVSRNLYNSKCLRTTLHKPGSAMRQECPSMKFKKGRLILLCSALLCSALLCSECVLAYHLCQALSCIFQWLSCSPFGSAADIFIAIKLPLISTVSYIGPAEVPPAFSAHSQALFPFQEHIPDLLHIWLQRPA